MRLTPSDDHHGEFEIAIERKQHHEDQHDRERADDGELRFGFEQFAVFAAPFQMIALGQVDGFLHGGLTVVDDAFEIAAFDGELHADIARIVFAVDKRRAGCFADGGELGQRNLLAARRGDQQIADLACAGAILRIHADDQVEEFFALNDLSGGLAADGGLTTVPTSSTLMP